MWLCDVGSTLFYEAITFDFCEIMSYSVTGMNRYTRQITHKNIWLYIATVGTYASYNAFKTVWPELFVEPLVFLIPLH